MTRRTSVALTIFVLVAATPALAQNVHLKGGANAQPAFNDQGLFLQAMGSLVGLGNGDVLITFTAQADVTAVCANQGGNEAPGQNPAPITVSGSEAIPADEIKNGTTPFDVVTVPPVSPIPGAPDCANQNWTEQITDLAFTSAVITVENRLAPLSSPCRVRSHRRRRTARSRGPACSASAATNTGHDEAISATCAAPDRA